MFVLSSCIDDRWDRIHGKRAEMTVTINSSSFGAGREIEVSRSAKAQAIQSIPVPIGDGLFLQAVLEPDATASQMRADSIIPFETGTRIRLLAYQPNTTTPDSTLIFDTDGAQTIRRKITLNEGMHRFVAYAYYHPSKRGGDDGYDTAISDMEDTITVRNILPEFDALYGAKMHNVQPSSFLQIEMRHLYSRITEVKASTAHLPAVLTIDTILGVTIDNYTANLHLWNDSLSRADTIPHHIPNTSWVTTHDTTRVAQDTLLIYPASGTIVRVGEVKVDGNSYYNVSAMFNTELQRGTSYKLRLNLTPNPLPTTDDPVADRTYVGAFWRAGERGERVIHIPVSGGLAPPNDEWAATVGWYDGQWTPGSDGVVLAMGDSPDPAIRTNSPDDAENYPVTGSSTINGVITNGAITFRIGLQKTYEDNSNPNYNSAHPVRYAVVLVYFGANKSLVQRIFLRQGEEPDNVSTNGAFADVQWNPYNVGVYNASAPYDNGGFVDFPTKAGYLYQWGYGITPVTDEVPHPYPPHAVSAAPWYANTNGLYSLEAVCPPGYRMPSGGYLGTSELESLWPIHNSSISMVYGYYADGFFDRRPVETPNGSSPASNSAVSKDDGHLAFQGMVFYNSSSYASVFFPAAGWFDAAGSRLWPGDTGTYWGNNPLSTTGGNAMHLFGPPASVIFTTGAAREVAASVRCLKEPPSLSVDPANLSFAYDASAGQNVTVETNQPGWTASSDQPWCAVSPTSGTDGQTFTVTCPTNTGDLRTATITVTSAGGAVSTTVTVTQEKSIHPTITCSGCDYPVPPVTFMAYNLGADPQYDTPKKQMEYMALVQGTRTYYNGVSNVTITSNRDAAVFGGLFQWGRKTWDHAVDTVNYLLFHGNGLINNAITLTAAATYDSDGQILTYDGMNPANNLFVLANSTYSDDWSLTQKDDLWGNGVERPVQTGSLFPSNPGLPYLGNYYQSTSWVLPQNNPCPAGWRLPTQDEWERLFNYDCRPNTAPNSFSLPASGSNFANNNLTAVPVDCTTGKAIPSTSWPANGRSGLALYKTSDWAGAASIYKNGANSLHEPGAPDPVLFLPAAGYRNNSTADLEVGSSTRYWMSTVSGNRASFLYIVGTSGMYSSNFRAMGQGIRCVADAP